MLKFDCNEEVLDVVFLWLQESVGEERCNICVGSCYFTRSRWVAESRKDLSISRKSFFLFWMRVVVVGYYVDVSRRRVCTRAGMMSLLSLISLA
jgi:hypothetical protein